MSLTKLVLLAASMAAAGWVFSGARVVAAGRPIPVEIHVSTQGLDLGRTDDAHKLYLRLKDAAGVACTHGNKAGLEPVPNLTQCIEISLANAIRSVNAPLLTQMYLNAHTVQQANAAGIRSPAQLAGR